MTSLVIDSAVIRPQTSPDKFDGGRLIDELAYNLSLSGCDDESGDAQGPHGWHGILRGPIRFVGSAADVTPVAIEEIGGITTGEIQFLASIAGCIVAEDSAGFVSVEYFKSTRKLDAAWDSITLADAADSDDDDN